METKDTITYLDFTKLDLKIGKIISVEDVPDSRKLLLFKVDIGGEERTILGGFKKSYGETKESLIGKQVVVLKNLEAKEIAGLKSEGMILAATGTNGEPVFLTSDNLEFTEAGCEVR